MKQNYSLVQDLYKKKNLRNRDDDDDDDDNDLENILDSSAEDSSTSIITLVLYNLYALIIIGLLIALVYNMYQMRIYFAV